MHALQRHHIVDLFVWSDDNLPAQHKIVGGRPSTLRGSELLTILIWDGLNEPHKTLKAVYAWIARDYADYFPRLPKYQNFVAHCHRLLPAMIWLLQALYYSVTTPSYGSPTVPCCPFAGITEPTSTK